jgi:2-phosphosulfolactate phosphatase
MDIRKHVEVCFTPSEYAYYKDDYEIVVVIDVLRATSAICAAFHNGIQAIIPVPTVEEAWEYKQNGYLAGAERKGQIVEGFDFGNSPFSYMREEFRGKEVVLTTTNGTKSLDVAKDAEIVVIGSFLNLDYFGYLKSSSHRRRLKNLNLNEDIKYCLTPNQTDVIPILRNGKLVKL